MTKRRSPAPPVLPARHFAIMQCSCNLRMNADVDKDFMSDYFMRHQSAAQNSRLAVD